MKKFIYITIVITIICNLLFVNNINVYAVSEEVVYFELQQETKVTNNRLFNINVYASSSTDLLIGVFSMDIYYDANSLEFKGISCSDDKVKIKYSEKNPGSIKLIYLNSNGQNISSNENILFSLNFKTLSNNNSDLSASVYQLADVNANWITAEKTNTLNIEVLKNENNNSYTVSENIEANNSDSSLTVKDISNPDNNENNNVTVFLLGMLVMIAIAIFGFICYNFGKSKEKIEHIKQLENTYTIDNKTNKQ